MKNEILSNFNIGDIGEASLPGVPSYYTTINQILSGFKWISLVTILIMLIIFFDKKMKHQQIKKSFIIVEIIAIIIFVLSMVIKMPYYT